MYGIRQRQLRPQNAIRVPASISGKHGVLFAGLVRTAQCHPNPVATVQKVRKIIQRLVRAELAPEQFVIHLARIFGSYQPRILQFLQHEPINFTPLTTAKDIREAIANSPINQMPLRYTKREIPSHHPPPPVMMNTLRRNPVVRTRYIKREIPSDYSLKEDRLRHNPVNMIPRFVKKEIPSYPPPPVLVKRAYLPPPPKPEPGNPPFGFNDDFDYPNDDGFVSKDDDTQSIEEMNIPKASSSLAPSSPPPPQLKPIYVEPKDPLMNIPGLLRYYKQRKKSFKAISQEAANLLGDFVNVQLRILSDNVLKAAKSRQPIQLDDGNENVVKDDLKAQLTFLDTYYLTKDLKHSKTEDAKRIMTAVNNRKQATVEAYNAANEVALAAIGGKKRPAWADPTIKDIPKPKNPYLKPCRINASDVVFALHKNKRLQNSWAYRNSLFLSSSASHHTKFI